MKTSGDFSGFGSSARDVAGPSNSNAALTHADTGPIGLRMILSMDLPGGRRSLGDPKGFLRGDPPERRFYDTPVVRREHGVNGFGLESRKYPRSDNPTRPFRTLLPRVLASSPPRFAVFDSSPFRPALSIIRGASGRGDSYPSSLPRRGPGIRRPYASGPGSDKACPASRRCRPPRGPATGSRRNGRRSRSGRACTACRHPA